MTGPAEKAEESDLWRHWRAAVAEAAGAEEAPLPDPLLLAAYAEGRLDEAGSEAVERWLAVHPEAIDDLATARRLGDPSAGMALPSEAALAQARALVGPDERVSRDPVVVPFRRPAPRIAAWRAAVAWGGMAAGIAATGLVGFALGSNTYASLLGDGSASLTLSQDLFDPPAGFLGATGEESDT